MQLLVLIALILIFQVKATAFDAQNKSSDISSISLSISEDTKNAPDSKFDSNRRLTTKRNVYDVTITPPNVSPFHRCMIRSTKKVAPLIGKETSAPAYNNEYRSMYLVCQPKDKTKSRVPHNFIYGNMLPTNRTLACPRVYDYKNNIHYLNRNCKNQKLMIKPDVCLFTLPSLVVTVCGGLYDGNSLKTINFGHKSIAMTESIHYHEVHLKWIHYYADNALNRLPESRDSLPQYDYVIPLRMIWDNSFGHLYHQSIPLIAAAFNYLPKNVWNKSYWHCSVPTAALLLLLDIPKERLLIMSSFQKVAFQTSVQAKQVILPWMSGWCPSNTPAHFGIAREILEKMTYNLLHNYHRYLDKKPSKMNDITRKHVNNISSNESENKRTILYLLRSNQTRPITNQEEILQVLTQAVNHEKYEFIIINKTDQYRTIDELLHIWHGFAKYFSRARVVIGTHGKS